MTSLTNKRSVVFGGGSSFGIAWELGILKGLADQGINLRQADEIIGTSAGSHVGAMITSTLSFEDIISRFIEHAPKEERPIVNPVVLFGHYERIEKDAKNAKDWVRLMCELSLNTKTLPFETHLAQVQAKYGEFVWPKSLKITTVDVDTAELVVWDFTSSISLPEAIVASSSLPGLWPYIPINHHRYCDGGAYSMENAKQAVNSDKVVVFSTNLPVATPESLDDQLNVLKKAGSKVYLIQPNQEVFDCLKKLGGNSSDQAIMKPIFKVAYEQGIKMAKDLQTFWEN